MPRHRRGHGEGSIYQESDGRWAGAVSLGDGTRKRFRARTRADVQRKLNEELKRQADGLQIIRDERIKLAEYMAKWLETTLAPRVRPSTFTRIESKWRVHIEPALGSIQLSKLTPERLQTFLNERLKAGKSPRTVKHFRDILRTALNDAVKWGIVARNVATVVDPPRIPEHHVEPLSPERARELLVAFKGDRLEALYSVALALGLRQGEAVGLQWSDIDLEAGTLKVQRALQRVKGSYAYVEPKTARSRRTVVMPAAIQSALKKHRARQNAEQLAAESWQDTGLVFTTKTGAPLYAADVTRAFQDRLKRAGLPQMRFHDLRHGCASLLVAQGVHPRVAMEILGHATLSTTMQIYSHVIQQAQRDAASKLDEALGFAPVLLPGGKNSKRKSRRSERENALNGVSREGDSNPHDLTVSGF